MKDYITYLVEMLEDMERYQDLFFEVQQRLHTQIDNVSDKS